MARKAWYDGSAANVSVRVVGDPGGATYGYRRRLHPKVAPGLVECLAYPLTDGPGVGLMVFLPPVLLFLSLPIFDVVSFYNSRADWALGLLILPIFLPLMGTFSLVFGYALLVFGHMFVASALGEPDHPRWPDWDAHEISEGLGRWLWAGVFGLAIAGLPIVGYWTICGDVDWFDRVVFFDLIVLGAGYALLAIAASLLHDSLIAANPFTVIGAIFRLGFDFVMPCLTGGLSLVLLGGILYGVLFKVVSIKIAVLGLWGCWVLALYLAMVVFRMVGLTYNAHADDLHWFQGRPKWGLPKRFGKIYSNS